MTDSDTPGATAAPVTPIPASPKQPIKANKFIFHGRNGPLYGLWFKKLLLSIVTLGIYSFWGKTNIRRYIVGAMELDGDRFEYLGTGKELFFGMLKILPFYLLYIGIYAGVRLKFGEEIAGIVFLPVILIIPAAMYSAFRYRFNRVSWRGIRTRMTGSAVSYSFLWFKGFFIKLFTLGFMSPSVDLERWEYQARHMAYGSRSFAFKGNPANMRKSNITTLLLAIPTLGFSRIWYQAALQREMMRGLSLGAIRFRSTMTGGNAVGFVFMNLLILIITLGFGIPIVMRRNAEFFARYLAVGGDLGQLQVDQAPKSAAQDAEGLQGIFDIDVGMIGA